MAKDKDINDKDMDYRTGGNTDEPAHDLGRNQFNNPDKPNMGNHQGQVSQEAENSTNPTEPVKVRPSHGSGKPGDMPGEK